MTSIIIWPRLLKDSWLTKGLCCSSIALLFPIWFVSLTAWKAGVTRICACRFSRQQRNEIQKSRKCNKDDDDNMCNIQLEVRSCCYANAKQIIISGSWKITQLVSYTDAHSGKRSLKRASYCAVPLLTNFPRIQANDAKQKTTSKTGISRGAPSLFLQRSTSFGESDNTNYSVQTPWIFAGIQLASFWAALPSLFCSWNSQWRTSLDCVRLYRPGLVCNCHPN